MKIYEKHASQDFDHPDEMKRILDYLNEHGTFLVKPLAVEKLYYEFSKHEYWVRWMRADDDVLEQFADWLDKKNI